jgi:hypothetical protein
MNPQDDSQNQGQEPEQTGNNGMPQAPMNGAGDNTQAPDQNAPAQGGENTPEMPEAPEAPKTPEAGEAPTPEAPAPDEDDKADGSKW